MSESFHMRGIDSEFWKKVKHYIIDKKLSIKDLILKALEREMDEDK